MSGGSYFARRGWLHVRAANHPVSSLFPLPFDPSSLEASARKNAGYLGHRPLHPDPTANFSNVSTFFYLYTYKRNFRVNWLTQMDKILGLGKAPPRI